MKLIEYKTYHEWWCASIVMQMDNVTSTPHAMEVYDERS